MNNNEHDTLSNTQLDLLTKLTKSVLDILARMQAIEDKLDELDAKLSELDRIHLD